MKKLLKSEVYRSHKQYTGPLLKCALYTEEMSTTAAKKKKKKREENAKQNVNPNQEKKTQEKILQKKEKKNAFFLLCFYDSKNLTRNCVLKQFCLHSKRIQNDDLASRNDKKFEKVTEWN